MALNLDVLNQELMVAHQSDKPFEVHFEVARLATLEVIQFEPFEKKDFGLFDSDKPVLSGVMPLLAVWGTIENDFSRKKLVEPVGVFYDKSSDRNLGTFIDSGVIYDAEAFLKQNKQ